MNKVILMGRLTRDPELKTTPNGVNVCSFGIAVDRRYQTKGEEKKADFFNIVAWRQAGEFVSRYFKKGNMILVEGELQTRQYTNKDGINVTVTEIIAEHLSFTGEKISESSPATTAEAHTAQTAAANNQSFENINYGDDYPF